MNIARDFFNITNSGFSTNCMITIGRDWYNSGNVTGPSSPACGGFNIAAGSYNTGSIGFPSTHTDICDAGNPLLGIDGNSGTIAGTTTYCTCNNTCSTVVTTIKEIKNSTHITSIYPNPASSMITITLNTKNNEVLFIEVRDMMGKTVLTQNYIALTGENDMKLNVTSLSSGTYIVNITNSHQQQTKQLFSVSR